MPRPKKTENKSIDELLEEFLEAQRALFTRLGAAPAAESEDEEEEDASESEESEAESEAEAEESEGGEEVDFPSADKIAKLKGPKLQALAKQINLDTEGMNEKKLRALLTTVANVAADETDDLEEAEVTALCKALSLTPKKKLAQNIEQLKEYFSGGEEEAEEEESEKEESEESESEEAEESESETESEEEGVEDDVDRAEVAKSADLPDTETMKEQLEAYNEAAPEDDQIEVETGKTKAAYRKLLEQMVDSNGDIAEWGEPYVKNGEVCCCGLGLDEYIVKGEKGNFGKCLVTGKIFKVEEDGEASEYKPKKAKK
jgi:hypothetical protein